MNIDMKVKDINFANMGISGQEWEFVMLDVPTDDLAEEGDAEEENKDEVEE